MSAVLALLVAASSSQVLTLSDALAEARLRNLDIKAAQARLVQARQASAKAWAAHLPQLSVSASYVRNSSPIDLPPDISLQPRNQFGVQAELRQALFAPSILASIQAAGQAERIASLNTEAQRRDVLLLVAETYHGALAQQELVRAHLRLLEVSRDRLKDTGMRVASGGETRAAFLRAQVDAARAEQALVAATAALGAAKLALGTLLQREASFDLAEPSPQEVLASHGSHSGLGTREKPEVAAAHLGVELAETNRRAARLQYLPTLGLLAGVQAGNAQNFVGEHATWLVGVGVTFRVWDGGAREAEGRERAAQVEEARAQSRLAEARGSEDVARSELELESARAGVAKAEQALAAARENQRLVEAGFRAGAVTHVEAADAAAALTGAEVAVVAERLQVSLAQLRRLKARGEFPPE